MISNFIFNDSAKYTHSHSSTLCKHNGEIYCTWYIYEEKEHENGQIAIAKYNKARNKWSKTEVIISGPLSYGNPVLVSIDNKLELFFIKIKKYWDDAEVFHSTITDLENFSLGPISRVNTPEGIMIRHRPLISTSGAIVPAYDEVSMTSKIYKFYNDPLNWQIHSELDGHYIQGDILSLNDNEFQLFLRAARDNVNVYRSVSPDKGKTWDFPKNTRLPCPLSGIAAIRDNQREIIFCCYNHTTAHKRTPISLNISFNNGVTFFTTPITLDDTEIELSYPSMLIYEDELHITFTHGRRKIKHIRVKIEEIINQIEKNNE